MPSFRYTDQRILIPRESNEPRHDSIIEGLCPTCSAELDRQGDHGWCDTCNVGWALRSTGPRTSEVTLVLKPDTSALTAALERAGERAGDALSRKRDAS